MIHYSKVLNGLSVYVDREIVSQFNGSYKSWVAGAALGVITSRASQAMKALSQNPTIHMLGLMDGEMVDEELLYRELLKQAQKASATVDIPLLGPVTFSTDDVEKLHRYILGG